MPSVAWKLARAASRAAGSSRAPARSHDESGAVNPSRYHPVGDPSSAAPRPPIPSEFNDEEAYLPSHERYLHRRIVPLRFNSERPGGYLFNLDMRSDKEGMPFEKKDLESEQTLWALYNRWLSYFNVARCSEEKVYRFEIFKERVRLVYELRNADPKDLDLNHLSDVDIDELCPPKRFLRC